VGTSAQQGSCIVIGMPEARIPVPLKKPTEPRGDTDRLIVKSCCVVRREVHALPARGIFALCFFATPFDRVQNLALPAIVTTA
jgi:hypothetical protein